MSEEKSKFEIAYKLDVNSKTEKKGGLTYLSWAWAWAEFKKIYPDAEYKIERFGENKLPYVYDELTGYMVFTEVNAGSFKHEMWLPVMDFKNQTMKNPTMFDINKTIMRCLTKNLAMFGLGLYIYAGEDLPESDVSDNPNVDIISELKKQVDKIKTLEELKKFYVVNRGYGADFDKYIVDKSNELKKQNENS